MKSLAQCDVCHSVQCGVCHTITFTSLVWVSGLCTVIVVCCCCALAIGRLEGFFLCDPGKVLHSVMFVTVYSVVFVTVYSVVFVIV